MIKPLRDLIVIEPVTLPGKIGLIYIPETKNTKNQTFYKATVLAIGSKVESLKVGDIIRVSAYAGDPFDMDGKKVHMMRERDIVVVVSE